MALRQSLLPSDQLGDWPLAEMRLKPTDGRSTTAFSDVDVSTSLPADLTVQISDTIPTSSLHTQKAELPNTSGSPATMADSLL